MRPSHDGEYDRKRNGAPRRETGSTRAWWQLRVWYGMTATAWFGMLRQNHFAVSPLRLFVVAVASCLSLINSLLALLQSLLFSRRIREVSLRDDPIFVLGHWRSGTTLLHELLTIDPRHNYPSTYACLAPDHFLVSETLLGRWLRFLLPSTRSQDDVKVDFSSPQEDDWALCTMGLPSPYQAIAFCRRLADAQKHLDLDDQTPSMQAKWAQRWVGFLKVVALRAPHKRLVLKSPLHTGRIPMLLSKFPKALFVHVVRDPQDVYASTIRLWRRLAEDEGLLVPEPDGFDEFVLENYRRLYRNYLAHAHEIPPERLYELRYEDLVDDPVGEIRKLYGHFKLDYAAVASLVEAYAAQFANFRTARYAPSERESTMVFRNWNTIGEQLGCRGRDVA